MVFAMNEILEPFDWWHSGRFWYCSLYKLGVGKVSGCGVTKESARADAQRDLLKREGKLRLRAARSAPGVRND